MNKKEYDRQRYLANKEKMDAQSRAYRNRNIERVTKYRKDWNLQKKYGITLEEYDRQWELQGRKCKICRTEKAGKKGFHVDHRHSDGLFRGILCGNCNAGLGMFQDSSEVLKKAAEYLCACM